MANIRGFSDLRKDDDDDGDGDRPMSSAVASSSSRPGGVIRGDRPPRFIPKDPKYGDATTGAAGGEGAVQELTDEAQLSSAVAQGRPVVVDYYATWCGPCRLIAPVLDELARKYAGRALFLRVDVDALPRLARQNSISAMPTFHFYVNGVLSDVLQGADSSALQEKVAALCAAPMSASSSSAGASGAGGGCRLGTRAEALASQSSSTATSSAAAPAAADSAAASSPAVDELTALFLPQLTMMGFSETRARQALRESGASSLEAALDWLTAHEDDGEGGEDAEMTAPAEAAANVAATAGDDAAPAHDSDVAARVPGPATAPGDESSGVTLHNAVCDVCKSQIMGVRWKCDQCSDFDLCAQHYEARDHDAEHTFTAHEKDIENPEKKPLTKTELETRKRELQQRLAAVRAAKAREEEQAAHEREKRRVQQAKESQAAARTWKEKQADRDLYLAKKEREAEKAAREKIRKQIEQDKKERKAAKAARAQKASSAAASADSAPPPTTAAASSVTNQQQSAESTTCKLQIKLADGGRMVHEFAADARLADVAAWLRGRAVAGPFSLCTVYPRKEFTPDQFEYVSLKDVDCVPRGQLVVKSNN